VSEFGYTVVEPEIINEWLAITRNQEMLVSLLYWLVEDVNVKLAEEFQFPPVQAEVIRVEYLGVYPAIGVREGGNISIDIAKKIEEIVTRKIQATSVLEFFQFALNENRDWNLEAKLFLDTPAE